MRIPLGALRRLLPERLFLYPTVLCLIWLSYAIICPLSKQKLRQRGMDPAVVLKDFQTIDTDRRAAITDAETMKARRNQLIEEFQRLKKEKQDTDVNLQEQKALKEKIAQADERVTACDAKPTRRADWHSQSAARERADWKDAHDNVRVRRWGSAPVSISLPNRIGKWARTRHSRPGARRQTHRRTLRRLLGPRRKTGARAHQLHARSAHHASTVTPRCCRLSW